MSKKIPAKNTDSQKVGPVKWSKKVTEHSDAMDLEKDVFKLKDPTKIAESIKRSAEKVKEERRNLFNLQCQ